MPMNTIIINLFGGPGCGKSTLAAEIFSTLKKNGISIEFIPEFIKSVAYQQDKTILINPEHQQYITFNQKHLEDVLLGKVRYLITDSPFLLGAVYYNHKDPIILKLYKNYLSSIYKERKTLNFFIKRDKSIKFDTSGRHLQEEESIEIDNKIFDILTDNEIPFYYNYYDRIYNEILKLILKDK